MEGESFVGVVKTGVANLASVEAGLRRVGATPVLIDRPEEIERAARLVLPGVGAFAAAMQRLVELGLVGALQNRIARGRPTLAICLGLQLLAAESDESPGITGFSIFQTRVERLQATRVPQLGWNLVEAAADSRFLVSGHAYFANSYGLNECPLGWTPAWTHNGRRLIAAVERNNVLACQFHPELSGAWGQDLLRRWLQATATTSSEERVRC